MFVVLANALAADGYPVELCVGTRSGAWASEVSEDVTVRVLGSDRVLGCLIPLARYLRRHRPRALYATMMYANVVAALARLLSLTRPTLVLREAVSVLQLREGPALFRLGVLTLARTLYRTADSIVCVSRGVRDDLLREVALPEGLPVLVVNNPLDPCLDALARAPLPRPLPWSAEVPTLLAIGRLSPHKDFVTLLQAVAALRSRRRVGLVILGEGEERARLLALAEALDVRDLHMPGFVRNPAAYLSAADVYVLSSRNEGFPNAMLEALAVGLPIVSTRCPSGPEELLEDGRWGALVPVGDADALARAIARALEDGGDRAGRRRAARCRYGLEAIVARYIDAGRLEGTRVSPRRPA